MREKQVHTLEAGRKAAHSGPCVGQLGQRAEPLHGREEGVLGTMPTAEQMPGLYCFADEKTKVPQLSDFPKHTHRACSTRHGTCAVWHQAGHWRGKKSEGRAGLVCPETPPSSPIAEQLTVVGKISFNPKDVLGRGAGGTFVFR